MLTRTGCSALHLCTTMYNFGSLTASRVSILKLPGTVVLISSQGTPASGIEVLVVSSILVLVTVGLIFSADKSPILRDVLISQIGFREIYRNSQSIWGIISTTIEAMRRCYLTWALAACRRHLPPTLVRSHDIPIGKSVCHSQIHSWSSNSYRLLQQTRDVIQHEWGFVMICERQQKDIKGLCCT